MNSCLRSRRNFFKDKTLDLDSIRQVQHSREITLRKQVNDDRFIKLREGQTENLFEDLERAVLQRCVHEIGLQPLFQDVFDKECHENGVRLWHDLVCRNQNNESILLGLIFIRKIFENLPQVYLSNPEQLVDQLKYLLSSTSDQLILYETIWIFALMADRHLEYNRLMTNFTVLETVLSLFGRGINRTANFYHLCTLFGSMANKGSDVLAYLGVLEILFFEYSQMTKTPKLDRAVIMACHFIAVKRNYYWTDTLGENLWSELARIYFSQENQSERSIIWSTGASISTYCVASLNSMLDHFMEPLVDTVNYELADKEERELIQILLVIGNLTTSDNVYIDKTLEKIPELIRILSSVLEKRNEEKILKEVFFIYSNLAAGDEHYIDLLFRSNIAPALFRNYSMKVESEVAWVLGNLTNTNNVEDFMSLLNLGYFRRAEAYLEGEFDPKVKCVMIESIEMIINKGKKPNFAHVPSLRETIINFIKNETDIPNKVQSSFMKLGKEVPSSIIRVFEQFQLIFNL